MMGCCKRLFLTRKIAQIGDKKTANYQGHLYYKKLYIVKNKNKTKTFYFHEIVLLFRKFENSYTEKHSML